MAILTENIETNGMSDASKQKNTNGNQLYGYTNSKLNFYHLNTSPFIPGTEVRKLEEKDFGTWA